jgi:hypothetical protein
MQNFEADLMNSVKCAMTKQIISTDFIKIAYDDRVKLPEDFMQKAWSLIDQDELLASLARRLETELVDRLVNQMAAELATDIKQVLSVKERREAVRSVVRENIDKLTRA